MTLLAFVDTETTGLDPERHEIWEVGLIRREEGRDDFEAVWRLSVDLGRAEPQALSVGRYYERQNNPDEPNPDLITKSAYWVANEFARLTHGALLVGAVPSFDDMFLRRLLRANGACPGWSHRLVCVETLVAGRTGALPAGLSKMAPLVGIDPEQYETHTALGDARLARDVFDAVMADPVRSITSSQEALSA